MSPAVKAPPWPFGTRGKLRPLPTTTVTTLTGQTVAYDIPKAGILGAIWLVITGTLTGTPSTPNALGMANLITRVRLNANTGLSLIDISGVGYHYLLRDMLGTLVDPVPQASARNAAESGTFDLSMYFPIFVNDRDPTGMIMLQNEDTQLRLEVQVAPVTALANDFSALSLTVAPELEVFSVPVKQESWPPFEYAHTITEEAQTIAGAGQVNYNWPRGGIYAQVIHGIGIGAAGADAYSQYQLRVNQSDYIIDATPAVLTRIFSTYRGRTRLGGVIPVDFLSMSGLGNFGSGRDLLDSRQLTDIQSVITATSAVTLRTVKRQLFPLSEG